ncbi:MAG TPA: M17 family peptidase N-terminal domain-containing protein, partial [Burkholderiales bacterium]
MEFSTKVAEPDKLATGALVVGIYESGKLSASAEAVDRTAKGLIAELIKRRDFDGKLGATRVLLKPVSLACERLVLVGL